MEVLIKSYIKKIKEMYDFQISLLSLIPDEFEVSELAIICGKHNSTIRDHLYTNYVEGKDYYPMSNKKGAKIVIAKETAIQIRDHYAKK